MRFTDRRTNADYYDDDPTAPAKVLEGWRDFLTGHTWTHFITVTYRSARPVRSDGGDLDRVKRTVRRTYPSGRLFLAGESHAFGDLHVHGILAAAGGADELAGVRAGQWYGDLFRQFGRSEVRQVSSPQAVVNYCTKYVTKQMAAYLID